MYEGPGMHEPMRKIKDDTNVFVSRPSARNFWIMESTTHIARRGHDSLPTHFVSSTSFGGGECTVQCEMRHLWCFATKIRDRGINSNEMPVNIRVIVGSVLCCWSVNEWCRLAGPNAIVALMSGGDESLHLKELLRLMVVRMGIGETLGFRPVFLDGSDDLGSSRSMHWRL